MKKRITLLSAGLAIALIAGVCFAEDVVVTARGKKYHKPTCMVVQNKEVTSLDKQKAIDEGYEPCGRCFKEDLAVDQTANDQGTQASKK